MLKRLNDILVDYPKKNRDDEKDIFSIAANCKDRQYEKLNKSRKILSQLK